MTTPDDAIRARRKLTNKIIAAHEALRLRPFLHPQVKLIVGDGGLIQGADQVVQAFAAQFQDRNFVAYVRETETVTVDQEGERAAEGGRGSGPGRVPRRPPSRGPTWRCGASRSASG